MYILPWRCSVLVQNRFTAASCSVCILVLQGTALRCTAVRCVAEQIAAAHAEGGLDCICCRYFVPGVASQAPESKRRRHYGP